jgi:anti-anti-sigma factor
MRRTMPATLEAAEEFFVDFKGKSRTLLRRANRFSAELLLREAVTNAVMHGCRADSSKQVRCWVRINRRRLLIAVDDDGAGFDWRARRGKSADLSDCCGRGIEILRKYASRVRYNTRGNAVTIMKRFLEEEPMIVTTREDVKAVVRPDGDEIVAGSVPDLRLKMRGIIEDGVRELVVDLTDVRMVDSSGIGLLISAHNSLRKVGGHLAVIHASAEILELCQSMRIHQHFSVTGN